MLHVGNDIVDLNHLHAKKKSRDIRFLKRVFLPDEERLILADEKPDAMLWALWTGKEAAYKNIQKVCLDIPAIPRLYKVTITGEKQKGLELQQGIRKFVGNVATPRGHLSLETTVTPHYVHSVTCSSALLKEEKVVWRVERMSFPKNSPPEFESLYVRRAVKRHLFRYWKGGPHDIEIRRTKGSRGLSPPYVFFRGKPAATDISLSHDGDFAAYAFTLVQKNNKT